METVGSKKSSKRREYKRRPRYSYHNQQRLPETLWEGKVQKNRVHEVLKLQSVEEFLSELIHGKVQGQQNDGTMGNIYHFMGVGA